MHIPTAPCENARWDRVLQLNTLQSILARDRRMRPLLAGLSCVYTFVYSARMDCQ